MNEGQQDVTGGQRLRTQRTGIPWTMESEFAPMLVDVKFKVAGLLLDG